MENNKQGQMKSNSYHKFEFNPKTGWFQSTKSGNRVYANKTAGHGKVLGGANTFARANAKELRSGEKFPYNPQGVSDTILYHCLRHDYVYYPHDFKDANQVERQRGFYDENADFHPNIKILYYPQSDGVVCNYCGHNTIFDVNMQNMTDLWCSQCGAEIDYMKLLGKEADFLVYSSSFDAGKELEDEKESVQTPYVPPQENPSYQQKGKYRKAYRGKEKSYADYIEENFGTGSNVEEESYTNNLDMPLQHIKTREYKPEPVKKWEPNTDLIIKSNRGNYEEETFSGFSFEEYENERDTIVAGTPRVYLDDDEPLQYIKTRPYNPAALKKRESDNVSGAAKAKAATGESLSELTFDEPLKFIKTREYKPAPVVQQTYHPELYKTEYVPAKDYTRAERAKRVDQAVCTLEDVFNKLSPEIPSMQDLIEKNDTKGQKQYGEKAEKEEFWSISDDADFSMFKKK